LKHTKAWSDSWLQKLKDDLRIVKADVAVLVTEALPKGVQHFGLVSGIWVTSPQFAMALAVALRGQLIEVATTKLSAVGKNEKVEVLYQYRSGSEFRQRVEAIVESFVDMQKDLQTERRTAELRWSKREKQIHRVIANTAGMAIFKGSSVPPFNRSLLYLAKSQKKQPTMQHLHNPLNWPWRREATLTPTIFRFRLTGPPPISCVSIV
jgi:hypothetical protein